MIGSRLLALDLGTSACKLAVVDTDGRIRATAVAGYATDARPGGIAEQDAWDWMRALRRAAGDLDEGGHLAGLLCLVLTGQMSALLPVAADGEPLAPCLIWSDQRATVEAASIAASIGASDFHRITGNPISPTYTAPKAMWLAARHPALYARTSKFLQPKDFIALRLTGVAATDPSDASCTGWLDLQANRWDPRLLDATRTAREKLPDILGSIEVLGGITRDGAAASGLPEGLPVVLGGGDGPVSALGAGLVRAGQSYISLGTSGWLSVLADAPVRDRRLFNLRHVVSGKFAVTGSTQNVSNALAWAQANVVGARDLDRSLAATQPGADGLLCLPYLHGERTPYWDPAAAGVLIGLRPHHQGAHIQRAMAEGICHHFHLIDEIFANCGSATTSIFAIGGLTGCRHFIELLASAIGKPHEIVVGGGHATAVGASMIGAVAVGVANAFEDLASWVDHEAPIMPDPSIAERFALDYPSFLSLFEVLAPLLRSRSTNISAP